MHGMSTTENLEPRAAEALRTLLGRVSVLKLKEIRYAPEGPMLARVEVLGHSHTLACKIEPDAQEENLRETLDSLRQSAPREGSTATPVLIAPHLSAEERDLCKNCSAGYLDFEGNARLALGEVFIGKRSLPRRAAPGVPSLAPAKTSARAVDCASSRGPRRTLPGRFQIAPANCVAAAI